MINTYNTTLPPPIPPRQGTRGNSTLSTQPLMWFLLGLILVHMAASVVMFMHLLRKNEQFQDLINVRDEYIVLKKLQQCEEQSQDKESVLNCGKLVSKFQNVIKLLSRDKEEQSAMIKGNTPYSRPTPVAHLRIKGPTKAVSGSKINQWAETQSLLRDVSYDSHSGQISVRHTGLYYIYSQITFSKTQEKAPISQNIKTEISGKETTLLTAYSTVHSSDPPKYTVYQGGVFELQKGQKLYVTVTNLSLVSFNENSTAFGLYMLS
ncbi:CD40 ligand [Amia ocellicauda]|uniref:CD40 ligand n=1 Tax=Amia ocellicauda TaxID=2972642 RepID=UPI003463DA93